MSDWHVNFRGRTKSVNRLMYNYYHAHQLKVTVVKGAKS